MYTKGEFDLDRAFYVSCLDGNVPVAQWLYSLGINVHIGGDRAYQDSDIQNHDTLIWLTHICDKFKYDHCKFYPYLYGYSPCICKENAIRQYNLFKTRIENTTNK